MGVGPVIATDLIIKTENFKTIDTARKAASYAGVCPFSNASGNMVGKSRRSPFPDKELKSTLYMRAKSAVKQNQKTLYEDIESAFLVFKPTQTNHFLTEDINGSRVERKECKVMEDFSHLSEEYQWDGLNKIIKIETQAYLKSEDKTRSEMRYYITSKEDSAEKHLEISRNHWAIENNLHWSLDVVMGEGRRRKRTNNATENFSFLLKVILKLLRKSKQGISALV